MPTKTKPTEGLSAKVRRMTPARYTVSDAANIVGRHPDTLVRWRRTGIFKPSAKMKMGKVTVHLYTDADIKAMKQLTKVIKPGRPPLDGGRSWAPKPKRVRTKTKRTTARKKK
jgi:MerR HTH family regulatory protein